MFQSGVALLLTQASLTTFLHGAELARQPDGIASYGLMHTYFRPAYYHLVVTEQLRIFGSVTGAHAFTSVAQAYYQDYH